MTTDTRALDVPAQSHKLLPATVFGIIAVVIFTIALWSERTLAAGVLLSLSLVVQATMYLLKPGSRLGAELASCEYGKAFCILLYIASCKWEWLRDFAPTIRVLSLVAAILVTILITHLSVQALRGVQADRDSSLDDFRRDRVLALFALVLAFLHVTYFLSFAMTFSDQFAGRDLWAFQLDKSVGDTDRGGGTLPTRSVARTTTGAARPSCSEDRGETVRKFFFVQSAATMACTADACSRADSDPALQKLICASGVPGRRAAFRKLALAACGKTTDAMQLSAAAWNARELYELRNVFRNLAASNRDRSYLIEICGHANDTRLSGNPLSGYASNLEISKQRAEQIERMLQKEFRIAIGGVREPPVRWLAYGVSNEDSFLDGAPDPDTEGLDQKLSVEVLVQPVAVAYADGELTDTQDEVVNVTRILQSNATPRTLELIDYIYFTIYTITTTGYGDIVPVSSWAKFLVSIANLIELLFVVVLVNVVANVRPPSTGGPTGEQHANGR